VLSLLKVAGKVHSDLKSENVLVKLDYTNMVVQQVKVIDFGSSFDFSKSNSAIELTTPEYLPPEVLEFIEFKKMNMGNSYNDEVK
jgi:serine/threonine protein kinase